MVNDKKNIVQSVGKAFQLMEAFRSEEPEQVLADLARKSALDNATTFRLLNTLVRLGYVEKVENTRRFRLTLKCLDLGFNAIARSDLRTLSRPLLRRLVGKSIEAASVGVLDGHEIVYVERIQAGLVRLALDVRIGSRIPLHSSALGLAVLSSMSEAKQREMLGRRKLRQLTPTTVTDVEKIIRRLRSIRSTGYVVSDQENVTGLRVIAAPVTDIDGTAIAAVSAAAPAFGQTRQEFESVTRQAITMVAADLSRAMHASGSTGVHKDAV
jgi:IclR family transcriptional regulator, pca regulon regulatory protein